MKYLLGLLVLLNITDAVLTHFLVELGIGQEGNPFLLGLVGEPAFLVLKVTGVLLAALILWDVHRRHPRLASRLSLVFVLAYGIIVTWNASLFFA